MMTQQGHWQYSYNDKIIRCMCILCGATQTGPTAENLAAQIIRRKAHRPYEWENWLRSGYQACYRDMVRFTRMHDVANHVEEFDRNALEYFRPTLLAHHGDEIFGLSRFEWPDMPVTRK